METIRSSYYQWSLASRVLFWVFLTLSAIALVALGLTYFYGNTWAHPITPHYQFKPLRVEADRIYLGLFSFPVYADSYLTEITYQAQNLRWPVWLPVVFTLVAGVCLSAILAVAVKFERRAFLIAMSVAILIMATWRLDALINLDFMQNGALLVTMIVVVGVAFLIHTFFDQITLLGAFLIFLILWLGIIFALYNFSPVEAPFETISSGFYFSMTAITILFIFTVAHEIPAGMVNLITGGSGKNHMANILITFIIYVLVLISSFLVQTGKIPTGWIYVRPVYLLVASSIIGIWGIWQRLPLYSWFRGLAPGILISYLAVMSLVFFYLSNNYLRAIDSFIEAIDDAILYAHTGFGIAFLLYLMSSFRVPLLQNAPVYRVLYNPRGMPWATSRFIGLIAFGGLVAYSGFVPWHQARAGFYNILAAPAYTSENIKEAEAFLQIAKQLEPINHHSNYALASLSRKLDDDAQIYFFSQAYKKNPLPQDYIALAQRYQERNRFFDALFTLQDGMEIFPANPYIAVNQGVIYGNVNVLDSALYFLESGIAHNETRDESFTNMLGVFARASQSSMVPVDSLLRDLRVSTASQKINYLAWYNKFGKKADVTVPDTLRTLDDFYLFYNASLNNLINDIPSPDTTLNIAGIPAIQLRLINSLHYYKSGDVTRAFTQMEDITDNPMLNNYKYRILGLWALQQHEPQMARTYFASMMDEDQQQYLMAMTSAMEGNFIEAQRYLNGMQRSVESAGPLAAIVSSGPSQLNDTLRLGYYYLKPDAMDTSGALLAKKLSFFPPVERKIRELINAFLFDEAAYFISLLPAEQADYWNKVVKMYETDMITFKEIENNPGRILLNLFDEPPVVAAILHYLNQDELEKAYDTALEALRLNPYDAKIIELYTRAAILMGVESFAQNEYSNKKQFLSVEACAVIENTMEKTIELVNKQSWDENIY